MGTDEQLLVRVCAGDEGALGELLGRYEEPLSHFIYRHTGGRDVEDIFQETWLRVVRFAARFDPSKRFSTWLFQIAVNLCRDWRRRLPPEPMPPVESAGASVPFERAEAGLDAQRLLSLLPEPQREVLILRYYHDLTEAETAAVLDCPQGTVKSRLHQALARLTAFVRAEEQ